MINIYYLGNDRGSGKQIITHNKSRLNSIGNESVGEEVSFNFGSTLILFLLFGRHIHLRFLMLIFFLCKFRNQIQTMEINGILLAYLKI